MLTKLPSDKWWFLSAPKGGFQEEVATTLRSMMAAGQPISQQTPNGAQAKKTPEDEHRQ